MTLQESPDPERYRLPQAAEGTGRSRSKSSNRKKLVGTSASSRWAIVIALVFLLLSISWVSNNKNNNKKGVGYRKSRPAINNWHDFKYNLQANFWKSLYLKPVDPKQELLSLATRALPILHRIQHEVDIVETSFHEDISETGDQGVKFEDLWKEKKDLVEDNIGRLKMTMNYKAEIARMKKG